MYACKRNDRCYTRLWPNYQRCMCCAVTIVVSTGNLTENTSIVRFIYNMAYHSRRTRHCKLHFKKFPVNCWHVHAYHIIWDRRRFALACIKWRIFIWLSFTKHINVTLQILCFRNPRPTNSVISVLTWLRPNFINIHHPLTLQAI